jgi:hypothetical protein
LIRPPTRSRIPGTRVLLDILGEQSHQLFLFFLLFPLLLAFLEQQLDEQRFRTRRCRRHGRRPLIRAVSGRVLAAFILRRLT